MYLDTIGEQSRIFLYSCGFGFVLSVLFDVFEFVGEFLPKRKGATIIRDIIYMAFSAVASFIFSLSVDDGSFRFYIYAAFAVGWLVYYFSFGAFTRRVRFEVSSFFRRLFSKIKSKISKKTAKNSKKNKISSDLLLQDEEILLYNKKDNSKKKGSKISDGKKRKRSQKIL